jgi:predicted nucleic acid-binding protein
MATAASAVVTPGSALVVDASVAAAWLLHDEATDYTESALHATAVCEVWVPALWLLEVGNLLLSAQKRGRIDTAKRLALVQSAADLRLRVDREPVSMMQIDALATRHQLTAYDAAYLELAQRRRLPLATLDRALVAALATTDAAPVEFAL